MRIRPVAAAALLIGAGAALAQEPTAYRPQQTPWGAPDLQGVWIRRTLTPFERPQGVGGREKERRARSMAGEHEYAFMVAIGQAEQMNQGPSKRTGLGAVQCDPASRRRSAWAGPAT